MKKAVIIVASVVVLAAGAVLFFALRGGSPVENTTDGGATRHAVNEIARREAGAKGPGKDAAESTSAAPRKRKLQFVRGSAADRTDLPAGERRLLAAIESAVEQDSLKALQRVMAEAGASANPEVRGDLVEALGWFGEKALLDLMPFMADEDADVAQSAIDNWIMALSDIEDEKERSRFVVSAMKILTDKDALDTMIMQLDDCDDVVGMQAIVDVIESPNKVASEVAREHYEFTTGEKYVNFDTASDWIAKNYVPDDPED